MDHKYSTWVLVGLMVMVVIVAVEGIDGIGNKGVVAKFTLGGVISNSSLVDDMPNGTIINISTICTTTNNLCNGTGNGSTIINNFTYNITNNITYNITNNITIQYNASGNGSWLYGVNSIYFNESYYNSTTLNMCSVFNDTSKIPTSTLNLSNDNQWINSSYGNLTYILLSHYGDFANATLAQNISRLDTSIGYVNSSLNNYATNTYVLGVNSNATLALSTANGVAVNLTSVNGSLASEITNRQNYDASAYTNITRLQNDNTTQASQIANLVAMDGTLYTNLTAIDWLTYKPLVYTNISNLQSSLSTETTNRANYDAALYTNVSAIDWLAWKPSVYTNITYSQSRIPDLYTNITRLQVDNSTQATQIANLVSMDASLYTNVSALQGAGYITSSALTPYLQKADVVTYVGNYSADKSTIYTNITYSQSRIPDLYTNISNEVTNRQNYVTSLYNNLTSINASNLKNMTCSGTTVLQNATTSGSQCYQPTLSENQTFHDINISGDLNFHSGAFVFDSQINQFNGTKSNINIGTSDGNITANQLNLGAGGIYMNGGTNRHIIWSTSTGTRIGSGDNDAGDGIFFVDTGNNVMGAIDNTNYSLSMKTWIFAQNISAPTYWFTGNNTKYAGCTFANEGTMVYNYTLHKHMGCNGTAWNALY